MFAQGQRYALPGPDDETTVIALPGRDPVMIPIAVAYALRYDLTKSFPESHKKQDNRTWWRILTNRCTKCCAVDRDECACGTTRSGWGDTFEGKEWSREYRVAWTRRERAAAARDGRCNRCFMATPPKDRKICLSCCKKDRARKKRLADRRAQAAAEAATG